MATAGKELGITTSTYTPTHSYEMSKLPGRDEKGEKRLHLCMLSLYDRR